MKKKKIFFYFFFFRESKIIFYLDAKEGAKIKEWKLTGMDEILTDLEVIIIITNQKIN